MLLLHVGMFLGILPCMFSPGLVLPDTLEDSPKSGLLEDNVLRDQSGGVGSPLA